MHKDHKVSGAAISVRLCVLLLSACLTGNAGASYPEGMEGDRGYTRDFQSYQIPDVTLLDRNGAHVELRRLLSDQRPVLLQFIFTSCQTICPMLTAVMAQAQDELRRVDADTRIISISIDPDHDTPERLQQYAAKFGAEGDWLFLTGAWQDVRKTLQAFDAMYEGGSKMYHKPYTFMRRGPDRQWLRLIGVNGVKDLVDEYRQLSGKRPSQASGELITGSH